MKHIITTLFAILIIMATCIKSFAQMGNPKQEDVLAIKSRTLIVIVEEPQQKVIDKLNKKGKGEYIDQYKKAIDDFNTKMKDAVDKYWTFSSKIEYKTVEETKALLKSGGKYAVLRCATQTPTANGLVKTTNGINWTYTDFKNGQKEDNEFWKSVTILGVGLVQKDIDGPFEPVFYLGLQDIYPLESDIIFGVRGVQWYLAQREQKTSRGEIKDMIKENALHLKDKTLAIREDYIDPKLGKDGIKTVYPYKVEADSKDEFDQHLINGDEGYGILEVTPLLASDGNRNYLLYVYYVLDASTGEIIGYVFPPKFSLGSVSGSKTANERVFKDLTDESVGK